MPKAKWNLNTIYISERLQMESLYPEAAILDISVSDPYSSLFFSICD